MRVMPIAFRRSFAWFVLFGAAVVASGGCSGSGSSPTAPSGSIAFAADRNAGPGSIGWRRGAGTTSTRLELELFANQVTGVHDVAVVVSVPSSLLRVIGQRQGSFLTQDGAVAALVATSLPPPFQGVLIIDARPDAAPGVSGSGVIYTLEIDTLAAGSGRVELVSPEARDSADQPIAGIDWISGTATVVR
jgi:hypothetical protein